MKPKLSPCGKYMIVQRLTGRGLKSTYIPVKTYKANQKRFKNRCRVRVVIDGKSQAVDPMHILFGPAHKDVNPKAPPDWSPENHKEFTEKWT